MKYSRTAGSHLLAIFGILLTVGSVSGSQYLKMTYEMINKGSKIIVIGEVTKIKELPAYGKPKIEPRLVTIKVLTSIRGEDTPKEITFETRKYFGLDYQDGMEGVFFFWRKKDKGNEYSLIDERAVGVFNRKLGS